MKKIITIPDSLLQDLEILTAKAKKGRKRYGLSNYIVEVLQERVKADNLHKNV